MARMRGGKIAKSMLAVPGVSDGAVSTVKIDGSGWSKLIEPMVLKWRRSDLYGACVPCQATTSSGEWSMDARQNPPVNLAISSKSPSTSSYQATGVWKSRAFARQFEPMGPSSGKRRAAPKFSSM
ncbi:hypothetical protein G6F32_016479 [Rhizopus arrhizus]|nr:hypothetical protein G6F32_016479 [Rhizopus arrhizus]